MSTEVEGTDMDRQVEEKRGRLKGLIGSGPAHGPAKGINHLAVFVLDLEATAEFYINVLGMPVVSVTPNRDSPDSTHMVVEIGNGVGFAFFDFPHVERLKVPAPEGVGGIMHAAIPVQRDRFNEILGRLDEHQVDYQRIEDSVYLRDPNGLTLELMADD